MFDNPALSTGQQAADGVDADAMSIDEAEVREEVAEAVQAARKEGLRDDLLGMVCPSDWKIQAPEPLGTLPCLHRHSSHVLAVGLCRMTSSVSAIQPHFWSLGI